MKFKSLLKLLCVSSILFFSALGASAQTYNTPDYTTNITVTANKIVAAAGNSNAVAGTLTSIPVTVNPGVGIGLSVKWHNVLTTATTNEGFYINVTPDGSNWFSPPPYYFELKHVANTTNFVGTNMPASWFDGFMAMRLEGTTNCDLANAITNDAIIISRKRLDY